MSDVQTPVSQEREITIYATRGGQMKKIKTTVQTWGELKPLVRNEGFDLSSLLAAENVTKTDLVNDLAALPKTDFRLFLRPAQVKSGNAPLSRKECLDAIRDFTKKNPAEKDYFIVDGKNPTLLKTDVLRDLISTRIGAISSDKIDPTPVTEVSETSPEATEDISVENISDEGKVEKAIALISDLEHFKAQKKATKFLYKLLKALNPSLETEEEALKREAKEMGY
jgi:hypothetical protein